MAKTLIDDLPLDAKTRRRLAQIAKERNRTPDEIAAAVITTGLADLDQVLEEAQIGIDDADAGGMGTSHDDMLRYFDELASGKTDVVFPEATVRY